MTTAAHADRRRRVDELEHSIVSRAERMSADMYAFLVDVREFDELGGFLDWGQQTCAEWLAWRCDIGMNAARERVRVAHALDVLPLISAPFAAGKLSYAKARALTRVATRENESGLLTFAMKTTAVEVESRVAQMHNARPESTAEAQQHHEQTRAPRVARPRPRDDDDHGRDPLRAGRADLPRDRPRRAAARRRGACGNRYELARAPGRRPRGRGSVVSRGRVGRPLEQRGPLSGRRSRGRGGACGRRGPVGPAGRVRPPPRLRRQHRPRDRGAARRRPQAADHPVGAAPRALVARRGCAFPGCTHTRFVDAHHVRHWTNGGETSLANLLLLCSAHHTLVHELAFGIVKDAQGRWCFRQPNGRAIPAHGWRLEPEADGSAENPPAGDRPAQHADCSIAALREEAA
jgi:hypothetical protein